MSHKPVIDFIVIRFKIRSSEDRQVDKKEKQEYLRLKTCFEISSILHTLL